MHSHADALKGETVEFNRPSSANNSAHAWTQARAFIHEQAANTKGKLPLVVFLHGLNTDQIQFRWMGGSKSDDLRRIASRFMETNKVSPFIIAAPSLTDPKGIFVATTSWPGFDLNEFVTITENNLSNKVTIDHNRIIVVGHSGGGCNDKGGIATALQANPFAVLAVDTCMSDSMARQLATAGKNTHVIVTWQEATWTSRPIQSFQKIFSSLATPGKSLRELDKLPPKSPMPHDLIVEATLEKWLPKLLGTK